MDDPSPFVDAAWLESHFDSLRVLDARFYLDGRSGFEAYCSGHLPGAVFVDLTTTCCKAPTAGSGRHPLPEPAAFAAAIGALGIGDDDCTVAYDDAGGVMAARLVWMLRSTGRRAALLDGGIAAWPGELETTVRTLRAARFSVRPWPDSLLAAADELEAVIDRGGLVIDAREPRRFRGEFEPLDPRAGHIPRARSVPCRENLGDDGRLLATEELAVRFGRVGIGPSTEVVSSCGSGITACHNLLAIEQAGLGAKRLYPGSFSEWSADPSRPVALGAD